MRRTEAQGIFPFIQAGKTSPEKCSCSHAHVTILLRSEQDKVSVLQQRTVATSLVVQRASQVAQW